MPQDTSDLITFDTDKLRFVCISDTHNDDPSPHIQDGDIFIHAGDMTDMGSFEELERALKWISSLSHKVKVIVAGNHDVGLDPSHKYFDPSALALFQNEAAKVKGIIYLDRETKTIAYYTTPDRKIHPLRIYGNPTQPEFLRKPYAFIYPPSPSPQSTEAWTTAPSKEEGVDIWVMHSPPKGRLDAINVPPLTGCPVQLEKIAKAKPMLAVFGHYHYSWGVERVRWLGQGSEADNVEAKILAKSNEQAEDEGGEAIGRCEFDVSGEGEDEVLENGRETMFVNAAWMTMKKGLVEERNSAVAVRLGFLDK